MRVARLTGMAREWIDHLEERTRQFAIDTTRFCRLAGRHRHLWSACNQLVDAAGSVASNHRAMRRARSTREFAAKLQIVNEEIDESAHWLEVIRRANDDADVASALPALLEESLELRNIFARSRRTTRTRFSTPPKR